MRKITKEAVNAFLQGYDYSNSNTKVLASGNTVSSTMTLFGNLIAIKNADYISITNAGYFTATTKERLNGIPGVSISQSKGVWYLNGKEWDGEWIMI
jgi:hypothetical protein